jgi:DNA-binding CsgD family transcriptional regulator
MTKKAFIKEIKKRCSYLHDRNSFKENIFNLIKEEIPHVAGGVTGIFRNSFDARGILYGYTPQYFIDFNDFYSESYDLLKGHFTEGSKIGFVTVRTTDMHTDFKKTQCYRKIYKPYGFRHGMQTIFFSKSEEPIGICGLTTNSKEIITDEQKALFNRISPYIFYAYRKYRWLFCTEFFSTTLNNSEYLYGILAFNKNGKIVWSNPLAKIFMACKSEVQHSPLPAEVKNAYEKIVCHIKGIYDTPLIFQEFSEKSPFGNIYTFGIKKDFYYGLPMEDKGVIVFIEKTTSKYKSLLTNREHEILQHIIRGRGDKEISNVLYISERTVHNHVYNLLKKFGVNNRTEAAILGKEMFL